MTQTAPNIIIVASPHKVGSTWLFSMLSGLGYENADEFMVPPEFQEHPPLALMNLQAPGLNQFLESIPERKISFKSHSIPPANPLPDNVGLICLLRDPRDLLVSWVCYLASLPAEYGGAPELIPMSVRDRVSHTLIENYRSATECNLYTEWANSSRALMLKYEHLLASGEQELRKICDALNIEASDDWIRHMVDQFSFESMKRSTGDANFFRKGQAGDWRNHFDAELVETFKTANFGLWNRVLVQMGYESDLDWKL